MLVLSRKVGEVITVGSSVKVTVLSYDRGIVRLGIEAPKSIPVHRKEVHDKIVEMNKKASKTKFQAFKDAILSNTVSFNNNTQSQNIFDFNLQKLSKSSLESNNENVTEHDMLEHNMLEIGTEKSKSNSSDSKIKKNIIAK